MIKNFYLNVILAAIIGFSATVNAGIPVSVIGDATATANQIQTMTQWAAQLEEMQMQYKQMKRDYESITGSRGLGNIFNNPALRNYLPDDWQKTYDDIRRSGIDGLSSDGRKIYNEAKIFDRCASYKDAKMISLCEAGSGKSSEDLANLGKAFDKAQGRIEQIQQLMNKINDTSDPKEIAELQARIQSESVLIENEQNKIAMYSIITKAQEELRLEQIRQINVRNASKTKGISVTNLDF